jgi:hypothetical protein
MDLTQLMLEVSSASDSADVFLGRVQTTPKGPRLFTTGRGHTLRGAIQAMTRSSRGDGGGSSHGGGGSSKSLEGAQPAVFTWSPDKGHLALYDGALWVVYHVRKPWLPANLFNDDPNIKCIFRVRARDTGGDLDDEFDSM